MDDAQREAKRQTALANLAKVRKGGRPKIGTQVTFVLEEDTLAKIYAWGEKHAPTVSRAQVIRLILAQFFNKK